MRHPFNFNGGEHLTTMGAAWFVSYAWFEKVDHNHKNWGKVTTYTNRLSVYKNTRSMHQYWLKQVSLMSEKRLNTNSIGLTGRSILMMTQTLLSLD